VSAYDGIIIPPYIKAIPRPHITIGIKPLQIIERDIKEISTIVIIWIIFEGSEFNKILVVVVKM
jgi:hypothetical protein